MESRYVHRRPVAAPAVLVEGPFTLRRGQEKPLISCSGFWKRGCELGVVSCAHVCLYNYTPAQGFGSGRYDRYASLRAYLIRFGCELHACTCRYSVLVQPRYRPFGSACRTAAHQAGDRQTFINSTNSIAEGTLLPGCMDSSSKLMFQHSAFC